MGTIVYGKGGDLYLGYFPYEKPVSYWVKEGKKKGYKWMYKGFRRFLGIKDQVVVFDDCRWDEKEIKRRRNNGFLGIKVYQL